MQYTVVDSQRRKSFCRLGQSLSVVRSNDFAKCYVSRPAPFPKADLPHTARLPCSKPSMTKATVRPFVTCGANIMVCWKKKRPSSC